MIRIICCENEHTAMIHTGGPADIRHKSFDVELPDIERWLDEFKGDKSHGYNVRTFVGFERIGPAPASD